VDKWTETYLNRTTGQAIQAWRKHSGLSKQQLTVMAQLPLGHLSKIESNKVERPSETMLARIADALGISLYFLITRQFPTENRNHTLVDTIPNDYLPAAPGAAHEFCADGWSRMELLLSTRFATVNYPPMWASVVEFLAAKFAAAGFPPDGSIDIDYEGQWWRGEVATTATGEIGLRIAAPDGSYRYVRILRGLEADTFLSRSE
jgi:transcriptional regulator with XRE-family HTH domain